MKSIRRLPGVSTGFRKRGVRLPGPIPSVLTKSIIQKAEAMPKRPSVTFSKIKPKKNVTVPISAMRPSFKSKSTSAPSASMSKKAGKY